MIVITNLVMTIALLSLPSGARDLGLKSPGLGAVFANTAIYALYGLQGSIPLRRQLCPTPRSLVAPRFCAAFMRGAPRCLPWCWRRPGRAASTLLLLTAPPVSPGSMRCHHARRFGALGVARDRITIGAPSHPVPHRAVGPMLPFALCRLLLLAACHTGPVGSVRPLPRI
jgi:hypothetical protein